jgi:hypothetical protein
VLSGQRLLPIEMAKKSFTVNAMDLRAAILTANTNVLNGQNIANLRNALASDANIDEEMSNLANYDGHAYTPSPPPRTHTHTHTHTCTVKE